MPPLFFHCWFIVDSKFQPDCIEIDGASVHTEAAAAAATCHHDIDRRRCFFELGFLLPYGWPPPSNRRLLLPPSHCYTSTMPTWSWWWSRAFDVMLRAAQNIMVRYRLYRSPLRMTKSHSVWVPTQTVVTFPAQKSYSENDKSSPRTRALLANLTSAIPDNVTRYLATNGAN